MGAALGITALVLGNAACGSSSTGSGGTTSATGTGTTTSGSTTTASGTTTSTSTGASACTINVCTMYGAAVPQVASDIVDAAAANTEFQPFFANLGKPGHDTEAQLKTNLGDFVAVAYGCAAASTYTGKSMMAAHAGLGITQKVYNDFITLIAGVLQKDGVAAADITNCFAPPLTASSFSSQIVGQ